MKPANPALQRPSDAVSKPPQDSSSGDSSKSPGPTTQQFNKVQQKLKQQQAQENAPMQPRKQSSNANYTYTTSDLAGQSPKQAADHVAALKGIQSEMKQGAKFPLSPQQLRQAAAKRAAGEDATGNLGPNALKQVSK